MRENHDLDVGLLKIRNLRIEPGNVLLVRLVVRVDIPVANLIKVVEPEAGGHVVFKGARKRKGCNLGW